MYNPLYQNVEGIEFLNSFDDCVGKTIKAHTVLPYDISHNYVFLFDDNTVFSFTLYANKDSNYDIESYAVEPYFFISKEHGVTLGLYDADKLAEECALYRAYKVGLQRTAELSEQAAKKQEKLATKAKDRALLLERVKEELEDDRSFIREITNLVKGV